MEQLSDQFLNSCPRENGFIIRGENMTRVETFVDAAFAFAISMLVISLDAIPRTPAELFLASKDIPAFVVSGIMIGFIWLRHSQWSRRFGLQDNTTIFLSLCLVMLVLVFIYPLKLVFMGMFAWLSGGFLATHDTGMSLAELANLFVYFAAGYFCLSVIFLMLYRNVLKNKNALKLTAFENYFCQTESISWIIVACTSILSGMLAKILPGMWVVSAGFVYSTLGISITLLHKYRNKAEEL